MDRRLGPSARSATWGGARRSRFRRRRGALGARPGPASRGWRPCGPVHPLGRPKLLSEVRLPGALHGLGRRRNGLPRRSEQLTQPGTDGPSDARIGVEEPGEPEDGTSTVTVRVAAVTVAVFGPSSRSATSPKWLPGPSVASSRPPADTLAVPSRMAKNERPGVPSWTMIFPGSNSILRADASTERSWRSDSPWKSGTDRTSSICSEPTHRTPIHAAARTNTARTTGMTMRTAYTPIGTATLIAG
jgi:hypothetical protein